MLAQYPLHNNKTLSYIEYTLIKLEKTKIAFENYHLINIKLFQLSFNYPKFYAITHFLYFIRDYSSAINNDTTHSKIVYKYLLKVFYGKTNKKEYKSQILEHNICYTNVIAMQDTILIAKVLVWSVKKKELVIDKPNSEVTQVFSTMNVLLKYNWHLDSMDNEATVDLGLQIIKKYQIHATQVVDEFNQLPDFLLALTIFVNEARGNYDQKI